MSRLPVCEEMSYHLLPGMRLWHSLLAAGVGGHLAQGGIPGGED